MRITILTVFTVVFGLINVNAQKVELGVKAGINFATVTGDNTSDIESITEFQSFGFVAEIPLSEKFSFQPEFMYSVQGFDTNDDLVSLKYLNIPLMGKYYVAKGLSMEAGPQLGYLLSAKQEDNDVDDNFNRIDFGVNFGLGYKLENGLNFGARYNLGLSNINDIDELNDKNRNGVFQVYVGFFF
ncbi:porin family protein [Ascidiimonas aurantiaca]|uniref:porin family protein n=1 Tax=Ascidiimonas aurantiaca TaxID=1685432 RepID=UPI0030EB7D68